MKIYIYKFVLLFLVFAMVSSCKDEQGLESGHDKGPVVTVYTYAASRPNNPDNDVVLRFAVNNKTAECYYLAEKTNDKKARVATLGEQGYNDYVISNGIKLKGIAAVSVADTTITDLYGAYTITTVAVGDGQKYSTETKFTGLDWTDVATGIYSFDNSGAKLGITSTHTVLQVCTSDSNLYRFKDLYGKGYSLKITLIDYNGQDSNGKYKFFRISPQETPFLYGTTGAVVSVRDIGYWQGSDAYVTDNGYESGMYSNYNCFIMAEYYVAAGKIIYGYDYFTVN